MCGDIVAVVGLKETLTGDTLCDSRAPILLERIEFPETVISMSIEPKSSADRDKLVNALKMLSRSDPTFDFTVEPETGQTLIHGMGELHLEVMCHRLERDMNVDVRVGKPRVAYRETITQAAEAEGRIARQVGGRAQFAVVRLRVEPFQPAPGQEHFHFESAAPADELRPQFAAAVEQGVRGAVHSGALGGYPLINVKVTLLGGQEHAEESTEVAFETAGALAVQRALEQAGPILLEPIMRVEVVTPEEYFGAINGDLMSRPRHDYRDGDACPRPRDFGRGAVGHHVRLRHTDPLAISGACVVLDGTVPLRTAAAGTGQEGFGDIDAL